MCSTVPTLGSDLEAEQHKFQEESRGVNKTNALTLGVLLEQEIHMFLTDEEMQCMLCQLKELNVK